MTTQRHQEGDAHVRVNVAAGQGEWTWVDDPTESAAARVLDGPTQWPSRALGLARAIAWAKMLGS